MDPSDVLKNPCEIDKPQCDNSGHKNDSVFFSEYILKLGPYSVGAVLWDQAERDVKCPRSVAAYPCLERYLVSSWQRLFHSNFSFVAIQLAGYTANINNGTGNYPLMITADMVFRMRLQQEAGCVGMPHGCSVVPTYDFSCSAGDEGGCPYGSVHQPDKSDIGRRAGLQLYKHLVLDWSQKVSKGHQRVRQREFQQNMLQVQQQQQQSESEHAGGGKKVILEGPRATLATAVPLHVGSGDGDGSMGDDGISSENQNDGFLQGSDYNVTVVFSGGSAPFYLKGTRNCTVCCNGSDGNHTVDFGVSADNGTFINGTQIVLHNAETTSPSLSFLVSLPKPASAIISASSTVRGDMESDRSGRDGTPRLVVRHTGMSIFPQCALYNAEGLAAFPFEMVIKTYSHSNHH